MRKLLPILKAMLEEAQEYGAHGTIVTSGLRATIAREVGLRELMISFGGRYHPWGNTRVRSTLTHPLVILPCFGRAQDVSFRLGTA